MRFAYLLEPPFNDRSVSGVISGCDIELARTVLSAVGIENIEFIETQFSKLLPGLATHEWDITTGLFDTPERRKIVAFSRPIWALSDGLLVKKGNPKQLTGYASASNCEDCILAAIKGQVQHQALVDASVPGQRIHLFDTYEDAANAVLEGEADAYASVTLAHKEHLALHPHLALDVITVPFEEKSPAHGAFGFRKSDEKLRKAIDSVLEEYIGSNGHRAMMYRYGFTDTDIDLVARDPKFQQSSS